MNKNNLKKLFLLTIFFAPVYLLRINLWGLHTNALDLMIIACLFAWFFIEKEKAPYIKKALKKNNIFFICCGFIFLGIFLSLFKSQDILFSLGIIKSWFLLPFLFALVLQFSFNNKKEYKKVFESYFLSALVVSIISIIFFFKGWLTYDSRLESIFNSPNYLAMYIAPAFLFGCYIFLSENKKDFSRFASLALILLVIFLTKSYASWISIFLVFLFLIIFYFKSVKRILVLLIVCIFLLFSSQFIFQNSQKAINFEEKSSTSSRIMIWKSAVKIIGNNLFLGVGCGNFQEKYLEYQKYFSPYFEWAVPHAHNIYLNFWISGGLFSFFGFLGLIVFFFINKFLRSKEKKTHLGAFIIILYFLLHGIFDTTYFKNDLSVIFWYSMVFFLRK